MHGFNEDIRSFLSFDKPHQDIVDKFFVISPGMRGRHDSTGKPDCNGFELLDVIDSINYARKHYSKNIDLSAPIYIAGGSGGGGNILTLIGKAPDLFGAAFVFCGMSDYKTWYKQAPAEIYKLKLESWIGTTPINNPTIYDSRSGLLLINNIITPLLLLYGKQDTIVPIEQGIQYYTVAMKKKKKVTFLSFNGDHNSPIDWQLGINFLLQHKNVQTLPENGSLKVHSFLVCRNFEIILSSPNYMGNLLYELNAKKRIYKFAYIPIINKNKQRYKVSFTKEIKHIELLSEGQK